MKLTIKTLITASVLSVAIGGVAQADIFNGGGDGTSWDDALNWAAGAVPTGATTIQINSNSQVLFDADSWLAVGAPVAGYNAGRLALGNNASAALNGAHSLTLDQGAGNLVFTPNSSVTIGGRTNKSSTLNALSGTTNIGQTTTVGNQVDSSGTINVDGADLIIGRGVLNVGTNLGDGTVNLISGSFRTRSGVNLGANGVFDVVGSALTEIGIGSQNTLDGEWNQAAGSLLRIGLDAGGSTLILVDDVADDGGGTQGNATFTAGSILEPYDLGGAVGNIWSTVLTWEGSLTGAPTLSTSSVDAGWESRIDGNNLEVRLVSVPEPSSLALLAIGSLAMVRRRRK